MTADPLLREHYRIVVREVERLIRARIPRLPLMPTPGLLTEVEVDHVAALFAASHHLAARAEVPRCPEHWLPGVNGERVDIPDAACRRCVT